MIFAILPVLLTACEKDFDIELEDNQPQLIVEGYINNESPLYNYVVLTRSTDYYTPGLANVPVSGATIFITEGELLPDHSYRWNSSSRVQLREANLPQLPAGYSQGFYFDPRLVTDSANALKGIPGKHYLLEIEDSGRQYSAITAL